MVEFVGCLSAMVGGVVLGSIYLGVDAALDSVVRSWAEKLVGGDPGDPALWRRAADQCASASAAQIDAFLSAEQERRALKLFQ